MEGARTTVYNAVLIPTWSTTLLSKKFLKLVAALRSKMAAYGIF